MRAKLLLCLIVIATMPSLASASDYTGLFTILSMAFIMLPWTVIHLVLTTGFAFKGRYASRDFALKHSYIASAFPVLGALVVLQDYSGFEGRYWVTSRNLFLCIHAGLLALAWLPMLAHRFTPPALPAHEAEPASPASP